MFNIKVTDNIKLSLEVSEDYLKNIIKNPDNVKNYKMLILNLHNSLELTFKFMLQSRNEFMIYEMQDSSSYRKVIETYKTLHKQSQFSTEKIPSVNGLQTVSFTKAYEILAFLYNVEEFDEKFIFKLKKINKLRNGLTHFEARVEHTDIIVLYKLFEECVNLYNSEIRSSRNEFIKLINDGYDEFRPNENLTYEFSKAIEDIKMDLLDDLIIRELVSFLLKHKSYANDIDLNDYEKLYEFFLDEPLKVTLNIDSNELKKIWESLGYTDLNIKGAVAERKSRDEESKKRIARIKKLYKESDKKASISIKEFLLEFIFLMIESDFMYERLYCDSFGRDVMSGISLTDNCKELILKKWNHNKNEICEAFNLSLDECNKSLFEFDLDDEYTDDEVIGVIN